MDKIIGKYKIEIKQDIDPCCDPRGDDNYGKMICFHNGYNLGDKHSYSSDDYPGWDEMEEAIIKEEKAIAILPLYLYDHSGITIATTPFGCRWDSGQIGFIVLTRENIKNLQGVKRVTKKMKDSCIDYMESEVKTYDSFIRGEVYGYCITDEETDEEIDSCWGFIGDSDYCMEEAEGIVKYYIEKDKNGQLELKI